MTTAALLLCAALAQGPVVPANAGWITDRAGLLAPAEEQALEALCDSYRAGSGQDVAVLTVPDLGGRPIEELALATARAWKIGDREASAGALLVVAQAEHELRIEVGRGLEGELTDAIAGRIIRDVIVPEFRAERFHAGLSRGLEAIHRALGGDYGALPSAPDGDARDGIPAAIVVAFFLVLLLRTRSGRRGFGRGSSALPWLIASQLGHASRGGRLGGFGGGFGSSGGGFRGFGGGGGFSGGGASGRW